MPIQEKKYKEYLSQEYEPVDESAMPYLVDIRAIKAYADSKGVAIASLSDEEKQQFRKLNTLPNTSAGFLQLNGILGKQGASFSWENLREDAYSDKYGI